MQNLGTYYDVPAIDLLLSESGNGAPENGTGQGEVKRVLREGLTE